jgi:hypothetical protein
VAYRFTEADVVYLRSAPGIDALATLAARPLTDATRLTDVTAARVVAGERFAAALETAVLRHRATAKLADADGWLLCDAALQQATPTPVAVHRAARLRDRDVHDVTCSIGADLVEVAAVARRCVGSDVDSVRLAMAAANCELRDVTPALVRADALHPVTRDTVVLADPARRDGTGLPDLVDAYPGRDLVVKCAPGLDFAAVPWAAEVELVSLDRSVREACLWTGTLATPGITRRATILRHDRTQWTITDAESDDCPVREPGEWLVDPDGAVVRAGLVRHYGARHGLGQLDPHIAYLTGDTPPSGIRAFRVLEHGRYNEKTLRTMLRRHDVGAVEILVRGLAVVPDELRRRLRPAGSAAATVVLTRIGAVPTAFLCEASVTVDE